MSVSENATEIERLLNCARLTVAAATSVSTGAEELSGQTAFHRHAFEHSSWPSLSDIYRLAQEEEAASRPILISGGLRLERRMLARKIHEWSGRSGRLAIIACQSRAETPERLMREIDRATASAAAGTLFLEDVDSLSLHGQIIIRRVAEASARRSSFVNGRAFESETRLVAGSDSDLLPATKRGSFFSDLYYRLAAFEIWLP
ncbi:MAG: sigma 54-interacting transcriptional regulator [Pyrinomonadaceae bacterium]